MSQAPKKKVKKVKKVVKKVPSKTVETVETTKKKKLKPTVSRSKKITTPANTKMLFGRENFKWVFIGIAFIVLGMLLMTGGAMPSPDVWDESLIYSHRRITLAPLMILFGLGIQVYAIFR